MASTAEGRELTAEHAAAQIAISSRASREARALWGRLDPGDLDGSTPYWLATTLTAVTRRVRESRDVAAEYLARYRLAEVGREAAVSLGTVRGTADALRIAGPVRVKLLIASGMPRQEAYDRAFVKFDGIVRRQTLMGGRTTIARTAGRDRRAIGWRRVTDGNPCAFCAMLASRGPAYRSDASAGGLQYHGHCGCTAEVMYSAWEPTSAEEEYVAAYQRAQGNLTESGAPRTAKNILSEMRREGSFRDSPK